MNYRYFIVLCTFFLNSYALVQQEPELVNEVKYIVIHNANTIIEGHFLTPIEMQILCNIFFYSYQLTQKMFLLQHYKYRFAELIMHYMGPQDTNPHAQQPAHNKALKLLQKIQRTELEYKKLNQIWVIIEAYLNAPEQKKIADFIAQRAIERLTFTEHYLQQQSEYFNTALHDQKENILASASHIATTGNCLQAIIDGVLPFNQPDCSFPTLNKYDLAQRLVLMLTSEIKTQLNAIIDVHRSYQMTLYISILFDQIYYEAFFAYLTQQIPDFSMFNMFNEEGIIPTQARVELLPHVID